jgi:hypothetical protein
MRKICRKFYSLYYVKMYVKIYHSFMIIRAKYYPKGTGESCIIFRNFHKNFKTMATWPFQKYFRLILHTGLGRYAVAWILRMISRKWHFFRKWLNGKSAFKSTVLLFRPTWTCSSRNTLVWMKVWKNNWHETRFKNKEDLEWISEVK